jgi:hypothetical protein
MMHYKGSIGKVEYDADAKLLHGEKLASICSIQNWQYTSRTSIGAAMRDTTAEPKWFRWLVLGAICLGIAIIVVKFLGVAFP